MRLTERRRILLLTEEENRRFTEAAVAFHVPRSLIILEAIQTGLRNLDAAAVPGRRDNAICFRLPAEIEEKVKHTAKQAGVSQQSLQRHLLFEYLPKLQSNRTAESAQPKEGIKIET